MLRFHQISGTKSLVKNLGLLALLGCALFGQEGEVVGWDPRETGELTLDWKTLLIGLLLALACCGLWKLLMWLLESRRAAVNWTKVRIWWPTAMLVWGWVLLALFARNESWGSAFDAVLFVFGLLNFPVLVVVGMLVGLLNQTVHPAVWVQLLVGSLTMWSGDYLLVRLAEWRAWINVPVSLHLSDPASHSVKDLRL
jgi:O-antigen/teichoic acid export membrane protein